MPERVLGDRYRLGPRVGSGGMATVYRATDTVLDRPVAVKVLATPYAGDENAVERFRREARAAAGLNHPNVVAVYDHGSTDGSHYIVMEHVEGATLADVLRDDGALPPERAAAIAIAVTAALAAAHEQGLVHRDVKPANVLLTEDGRAKVTDFGIARAADGASLTATGNVMGTATYIAPEQATGKTVDARTDIYSLGCVLYEMLAGRPPFAADSPLAVASMHVREAPVPPSDLRDEVPPPLEAVALRAMAKDPADRFDSAAEMGAALEAAVGQTTRPIERQDTAVLPAAPPAEQPGKRRWLPWAFAAAVLAAIGLFLLLRPDPLAVDRPGRAAAPPAPSPSPSPSPSPTPLTVGNAYEALVAVLEDGVEAGGITVEAADDVLERVNKAVEKYEEGKLEEALKELGDARKKVAERTAGGEIESDWAATTGAAIDDLETAMLADPPPDVKDEGGEDGDNSGPGGGGGNGKGNGGKGEED
ncbi:MAG TPA: protein kinase [Actinomycetota bacterium]|nr:protein kinase [Actinomycetota bacterium]